MSRYARISIESRILIRSYGRNHSTRETAKYFGVSQASVWSIMNNPLYPINYVRMLEPTKRSEPEVCKKFGCRRVLTAQEKLYGNKCIDHSKILII